MSTDVMYKAGEIYAKTFRRMHSIPIAYDPLTRRIVRIDDTKSLLFCFLIGIVGTWGVALGPQLLKLLTVQMKVSIDPDENFGSILNLLAIFFYAVCSGGGPLTQIIGFIFREEISHGLNSILEYETIIELRMKKGKDKGGNRAMLLMLEWGLYLFPYVALLGTVVLVGFCLYTNLDSIYFLIKLAKFLGYPLDGRSLWMDILLLSIRFIFLLYSALDIARTFIGLGLLFILGVWIFNHSVILLEKGYRFRWMNASTSKQICIHLYNCASLIVKSVAKVQAPCTLLLLFVVGMVIVTCNFVTFQMYNVLPAGVYLVGPCASLMLSLIIFIVLPQAVVCHEVSKQILYRWNYDFGLLTSRKYFRRKLWSMQPIHFYAGLFDFNVFLVSKSTKGMYFQTLLDYTVATLISK